MTSNEDLQTRTMLYELIGGALDDIQCGDDLRDPYSFRIGLERAHELAAVLLAEKRL